MKEREIPAEEIEKRRSESVCVCMFRDEKMRCGSKQYRDDIYSGFNLYALTLSTNNNHAFRHITPLSLYDMEV
jgi:hypothetical protein